jgi:PhoPQ-activated pathogenicity-related protein
MVGSGKSFARAGHIVCLSLLPWLGLSGIESQAAADADRTALDEYVTKPDASYSWSLAKTIPGDGYTTFVIDLKSQTWRSTPEVHRPVWQHWLVIVKPNVVKYDTAFLLITGGRNGKQAPDKPDPIAATFAKATNSVVAALTMIPNQPLVFNNDGQERVEDDLIAYTWAKYLDTADSTWLARLPMVKSAVRAMDTVTAFLADEKGGKTTINQFVVGGGSKRGWTTWLTGAVDKRVIAIVPAVIDVVNVRACSINHFCSYGFFAPSVGDYIRHGIFERSNTPQYDELLKIADPYSYRHRLTMPKFIVNASGDEYFPPDSSKFYFKDLEGVKYLRYVPNTDHSLNADAVQSILVFYQGILKRSPLPQFSWKIQSDGSIEVQCSDRPTEVNLWQATNPRARDFRVESIGRAYKKSALSPERGGAYVARVSKPPTGWAAFFVELVFPSGDKLPYKLSTEVSIVPDVLPHRIEEYQPKRSSGQVSAGRSPSAKPPISVEGAWVLNKAWTGYMGVAILFKKDGTFKYWFYSDVKLDNEPKYPISGTWSWNNSVLELKAKEGLHASHGHVYRHRGEDTLLPNYARTWQLEDGKPHDDRLLFRVPVFDESRPFDSRR